MPHFRAHTGQGVALLFENRAGQLVGIGIKAASSVGARDGAGLRFLAARVGERLLRGVLLYTRHEAVPFGSNRCALPVSAVWC